jgi:Uma2 family endonuclease
MSAQEKSYVTPEVYLAIERQAETKSEFVDGEIFLMAGASQSHNIITVNTSGELYLQFKHGTCQVFSNHMRVNINAQGNYVYPDVIALCEEPEFDDEHQDNLLNPALIIEVLSDSTETYDRGRKFQLYRQLASVQEYLLIAQDRYYIEHYQRQNAHEWLMREYQDQQTVIHLSAVPATLCLADVYARLVF